MYCTLGIYPTPGQLRADSGPGEKFLSRAPQQGESKETKHRKSYTRWPLAAIAVNNTKHRYLIIPDITDKDKKHTQQSRAPEPLSGQQGPGNFYQLPPPVPHGTPQFFIIKLHDLVHCKKNLKSSVTTLKIVFVLRGIT
jgi:hypothetical protein